MLLPPAAMLHYCTIPLRSETDVPSKLPKFLGRASTIPVKPTVTQGNATDVFNPPDHHIEGRGRMSVRLRYEMMVVCDHIVAAVCNEYAGVCACPPFRNVNAARNRGCRVREFSSRGFLNYVLVARS